MRFVVDTNIFVSALIKPDGTPGIFLKKILTSGSCTLIFTEDISSELRRTLRYPKIRKYLSFSEEEIDLWVSSLEVVSHIIKPKYTYPVLVVEDPKDDRYLIAALEGKAKYLISGDNHLLKLNPYKGVEIKTASEGLKLLNDH